MQSFSLQNFKVDIYRRPYQRSISLRVPSLNRLKVCCGMNVPVKMIFEFIHEKMEFVENCQRQLQEQKQKSSIQNFQSGESCPFLGQMRLLEVSPLKNSKRAKLKLETGRLLLETLDESPEAIKFEIQKFFKKAGTNYLSHLVEMRAKQMDLFPKQLSFRSQRTRWGSCSSAGNISLNWRLIAGSHEIMDYVVVHELAHLKHQDHSKNFWSLVETHCPDFRRHRLWLRKNHFLFDFLS